MREEERLIMQARINNELNRRRDSGGRSFADIVPADIGVEVGEGDGVGEGRGWQMKQMFRTNKSPVTTFSRRTGAGVHDMRKQTVFSSRGGGMGRQEASSRKYEVGGGGDEFQDTSPWGGVGGEVARIGGFGGIPESQMKRNSQIMRVELARMQDREQRAETADTKANASNILAYTSCDACHTRARLLQEFPEPDLSDGPIMPLYRYAKVLGGHLDKLKEKVILPVERTMQENKLHVIFMQYLYDALHLLIEKRLKKQGVDENTFEANEVLEMESLLEFQNYLNSKRSESGKLFVHSLYDEDRALVLSLLREQAKYDLNGFNGVLTWKYKDDEKDFMRGKLVHLSEFLPG